jgi:hypothetical protein
MSTRWIWLVLGILAIRAASSGILLTLWDDLFSSAATSATTTTTKATK